MTDKPDLHPEDIRKMSDGERLEGWKQIAGHLKCGERTAQRWEKKGGLPVHRHGVLAAVHAYKSELDSWLKDCPIDNLEDTSGALPVASVPAANGQSVAKRRPRGRWVVIVCTISLCVAATVFMAVRKPKEARRSVAVLGFRNLTGRTDAAWLSTAFAEMFRTDLTTGGKLRSISGEDVARMKSELTLTETDGFSKDTLTRIRKNLDSDLVLLGSYVFLGKETAGQIRLNLIVQDTRRGETIVAFSETGTEATLFDLVSHADHVLRGKLGVGGLSPSEMMNLKAALPRSLEAQRLFSDGIEKLRIYETVAARDALERAVQKEPSYALGHSALAEAWALLGYETKAQEQAKIAFDLSASLAPEEALSIEAKYREWAKEWSRAIEIYQKLCKFSPDNLEYWLHLARAQTQAGRAKEARAIIMEMRKWHARFADDPRIDLSEASIAESLGDFKRERAVAAEGAQKAEMRGARLLAARARLSECWALYNLGQPKTAIDRAENARRVFAAVGDRGGEAQALKNIADVIDDEGDHASARKAYEQALSIFRSIGYETGVAVTLNNLAYAVRSQGDLATAKKLFEESFTVSRAIADQGREAQALNGVAIVLWRQGDLTAAKTMFEEALRIHLDRDDKSRAAIVLGNIAIILQDQGLLPEAEIKLDESLAMFGRIGDKRGQARSLGNLGELLVKQGDLMGAKKKFEEQLALGRAMPEDRQRAYALHGLGEVFLAQGDLGAARAKHEEALALRAKMSEKGLVAESRLALAEVYLEEGNPGAAESAARGAADEFHAESEVDEEACARALLARALAKQRNYAQALDSIKIATEQSSKSQDRAVRLATAIAAAYVHGEAGQTTQAVKELPPILAEAAKYGYIGYQLDARLALSEGEMGAGIPSARAHLKAVEQDARSRGFGLVAQKAAAVRGSKPGPM